MQQLKRKKDFNHRHQADRKIIFVCEKMVEIDFQNRKEKKNF